MSISIGHAACVRCIIGVLFTGKQKAIGKKLDGSIRMGREFAENTFRKNYHALRTLHIHFQQQSEYRVGNTHLLIFIQCIIVFVLLQFDPVTGKHMGNSCSNPHVV